MVVAIVLVVLVVGSVLFHFLSPWYFTPIASNWSAMDHTISLTFWVTGFVFVAINLFMAYCVIRYRYKKGKRAEYEPENKKLEWWLTGLTTVGVAAMLAPGLFVWANFVEVPKEAGVFEAVGKQWHWGFRFPGKDGVMGTVDAKYVSDKNPFGMNPDDPNGQDDVLVSSPELHLPLGKPVKALLRSVDVLHNFAVPQFRAKMDLVPGLVTYIWFTPTRTGKFDLLCNELCGTGHFVMRGSVVVEEDSAFQAWLSGHPTFAQTSAQVAGDAAAGKQLYPGHLYLVHAHPDRKIRSPLQRIVRHRALCHARQRRGGGRKRFSGVVERPSDVRTDLGPSRRRCCGGKAALRGVRRLPWLAGGG